MAGLHPARWSDSPDCLIESESTPCTREALARALTIRDGVHPETLVPNTLDEEPLDGEVSGGREAHYAWRDRLSRVDDMSGLDLLEFVGVSGYPLPDLRRP